jgi:hypothetical protein
VKPRFFTILLTGVVVSGCARAAGDARQPAPTEAEPSAAAPGPGQARLSELDALEHDLDLSEQRLAEHLGEASPAPPGAEAPSDAASGWEASGAGAEAPAAPAPATSPRPPTKVESRSEEQARARADDVCTLSCRALQSMRRAATGICELVPGSLRCASAERRVEAASAKVNRAGCECAE